MTAFLISLIAILIAGSGGSAIGRYPVPDFTTIIAASVSDIGGTGVAYGRVIELQHNGAANGTLIAAYEDYSVYEGSARTRFIQAAIWHSWDSIAFIKDPVHCATVL